MTKTKRAWSKMIEESSIKVRLYTRPGGAAVYFSLKHDGRKVQQSTGLKDRKQAEAYAREVVRIVAEDRAMGRMADVTLGQVFRHYFEHRVLYLTDDWRKASETRRTLFETAWGAAKRVQDIGKADVDRFVDMRRKGELRPVRDKRTRRGVRDGTIGADLSWLSTVFRWAGGYRVRGRPIVPINPLATIKRPKETNVLRPIASHDRYVATIEVADQVDPEGRLRCMLALARYTGHRVTAICELRATDFLRGEEGIRRTLASLGRDEARAKHFPRGGLHWRAESDKQGYDLVIPIGDTARAELDRYLECNPRLGDVPLFPSLLDPTQPIRRDVAGNWLMEAEKLAKLPKLAGGRWHPYRRLWATERKHLPAQDVAEAGGWGDTQALTKIYQKVDPVTVLRVVQTAG